MAENNFLAPNQNGEESEYEFNLRVQDPGDPDGVVAAEKRMQWQEKHPIQNPNPPAAPAAPKPRRRWPLVVIFVVLLIGASIGAYLIGTHQESKKQSAANHATAPAEKPSKTQQQVTTQTKHYNSATYGLSFDYPADWTVSDTTAKLTVVSPAMQLMTAVGAKTDAHVMVTIQNQQTAITGFPTGGAVASLASDQLTYKQPSPVQRAQTYLSFLSYTEPNGLDALYLTGDSGYQQGQAVPMSDIVKGNPLIGVGFVKCTSDACASDKLSPVTLQAGTWKSSNAGKAVASLLESIVINS